MKKMTDDIDLVDYNIKKEELYCPYFMLAIKYYENMSPNNVVNFDDFLKDYKQVKVIKAQFCKYKKNKDINIQNVLNHIICLNNCFGTEFATQYLFFSVGTKYWGILKSFLMFMGNMPDEVYLLSDNVKIQKDNIKEDDTILDILNKTVRK